MTEQSWTQKSPVNLHLSCHCRTFASTITLPSTALPLKSALCHCSLCRHATGHIFATFAVIPLPDKPDCTGLTAFDSSQSLTRWFCTTCGCSIWNDDRGGKEWEICTGLISGITYGNDGKNTNPRSMSRGIGSPEGPSESLQGINGILNRAQLWVGSTAGDGGGATWVNGGILQGMPRYLEARDSKTVDDAALHEMVSSSRSQLRSNDTKTSTDLKLTASCACSKVRFTITRSSPTQRFPAGIDACWSCRKTNGFEITSWATIPRSCFTWTGSSQPITPTEEVFATYETTPGKVTRYFCTGCGVQAICCLEGRDTLDIGLGVLDVGELDGGGVRCEGWFVWDKYASHDGGVGYTEDAVDRGLVEGLVRGVERDGKGL